MSDTTTDQATASPARAGVQARVRIGSRVVGPDGAEQIGTVEKVVVSPQTRQVTHLLVHRGPLPLLHHDIMVPVAAVGGVNEDTVQLSVPVEQLNRTAAHDAADYATPGASWAPPEGYQRDEVLLARPRSGAQWDHLLPRSQGRTANTPAAPAGVAIGGDTQVETADGPIGTIDRVLLDPDTGHITHFVVRKGAFLAQHAIIPVDWAAEITPQRVRLAVDRAQLDTLPEYRPDDAIVEDVLEALKSYPPIRRILQGIESYEPPTSRYKEATVRVLVQDGVVILEGHVETSGHASMAAWLAQQVPGVRQVRNLLVADDALEIAVAGALRNDARAHRVQVRVDSFLGNITLSGWAPDEEARAAAEQVAAGVPRVRKVVNELRVPLV